MKKIFGNFYKLVVKPTKQEKYIGLSSAFIYDGFIWATNRHVLIKIPISNWVSKEQGLDFTEGKAIDYDGLLEMTKTKYNALKFTDTHIELYSKNDTKIINYSVVKVGDVWYECEGGDFLTTLGGDRIQVTIPNYTSVIPENFDSSINEVNLNPEYLVSIQECFKNCVDSVGIKLEFNKNNVNGTKSPRYIKVTPTYVDDTKYPNEFAMLMPISVE